MGTSIIMKKLKIIYLGNFENPLSDSTENHIKYAFEQLGHEVIAIDEEGLRNFDKVENAADRADVKILNVKDPDIFLFHKGGAENPKGMELLIKLLTYITCKKVCWYFDKVFPDREEYIDTVSEYSDYVFLTDDTFIRRHKYSNISCLRQGIGNEDTSPGEYKEELKCDIAFTGNAYQGRENFARTLQTKYGKNFRMFNDKFNRDLYNLCASAKIIVAPEYPCDEFYWSSRFYLTLGSGGFLVHPDLYGLRTEFTEGKHFAGYKGHKELIETIDYFLERNEERESIRKQGYNYCISKATYKHRVEEMLKQIYEKSNKSS